MNRLKQLREERKLSQVQLSMDLNTTQASISKYEMGKSYPDVSALVEIAKYFHVSVDYLLELTPYRTVENTATLAENELKMLSYFGGLSKEKQKLAMTYLAGLRAERP